MVAFMKFHWSLVIYNVLSLIIMDGSMAFKLMRAKSERQYLRETKEASLTSGRTIFDG